MSNDLLDKNGVWQGTLKQYYEFAKDIIEDVLNDEDEQIQEALMNGFKDLIIDMSLSVNTKWSPKLDQDKLEKSISLFAQQLEEKLWLEDSPHKLGLLIKHPPIEA
tara:strand:- start:3 stop:320 length:318 start_codon:yes stop_codon:yes gene_type:complete